MKEYLKRYQRREKEAEMGEKGDVRGRSEINTRIHICH